jgi:hypothetical protein
MRQLNDTFSNSTGYTAVNTVGRKARKKRNEKGTCGDEESHSPAAAT